MHRRSALLFATLLGFGCSDDGRVDQAVSGSAGLSSGSTTGTSAPSDSSGLATSSSGASQGSGEGGTGSATGEDSPTSGDATSGTESTDEDSDGTDTSSGTGAAEESGTEDSDSSGIVDGVLDIGITAHNDCTFTVEPPSITVAEGTAFTVNWVNSAASEVEFDIAKIDPFNQVPIVIGMEPSSAYHDDIREWCGDLFTGTFDFRLTSCHDPVYIPVDCGG